MAELAEVFSCRLGLLAKELCFRNGEEPIGLRLQGLHFVHQLLGCGAAYELEWSAPT